MLLTIIVYIYTVIAFNFFRKFYVQEEDDEVDKKCHDMLTVLLLLLLGSSSSSSPSPISQLFGIGQPYPKPPLDTISHIVCIHTSSLNHS